MNGIVIGLLAAFLQSCSYLASGRYARETGRPAWTLLAPAFFVSGIVSLSALPFAMPESALGVPSPDWSRLIPAATLCVAFCIAGNAATVRMLRHVDASRVSPLLALKVPLFAVAYSFVPKSAPTAAQWLAVALVVVSAALLAGAGRRIPRAGWGWLLCACVFFCLSDRCITWCFDLSREACGGSLLRYTAFTLCVVYSCGGVLSAAAMAALGVPDRRTWLRHALPYAAAWYCAMVALFVCFALSGLVLGNIAQSTRGLLSVMLGWLVARAGRTDMEERVGAATMLRRVAAAALIVAAMALYCVE